MPVVDLSALTNNDVSAPIAPSSALTIIERDTNPPIVQPPALSESDVGLTKEVLMKVVETTSREVAGLPKKTLIE